MRKSKRLHGYVHKINKIATTRNTLKYTEIINLFAKIFQQFVSRVSFNNVY